MIHFVLTHWLLLNILIPLIGMCFVIISDSVKIAYRTMMLSAIIAVILIFFIPNAASSYAIGDWPAPIGIEYILDNTNIPFIFIAQIIFLLFCMNLRWIKFDLEKSISSNFRHIIYALILSAQIGFIGIISTGDIFNLYVFIEIASLASYTLLSLGRSNNNIISAFEYLVIGTIAASLILLGIGMLFSQTGTLNMQHMHDILGNMELNRVIIMGICLFIFGTLIKIALFPMHVWMFNAYKDSSSIILTYIAPISSIAGFYILIRFIYDIIGIEILTQFQLLEVIKFAGIIAVLINSIIILFAKNLRDFLLFSSLIQIGYICIMISITNDIRILAQYILSDSMMKFVFFYFVSQMEIGRGRLLQRDLEGIALRYPILGIILTVNLISNIGLPITVGFFNKINLLSLLAEYKNYGIFIAIIISSVISIEYNFRLIKIIYTQSDNMPLTSIITGNIWSIIIATAIGYGIIFL